MARFSSNKRFPIETTTTTASLGPRKQNFEQLEQYKVLFPRNGFVTKNEPQYSQYDTDINSRYPQRKSTESILNTWLPVQEGYVKVSDYG
tara:strand:- start:922 stop:1191 length:270 start_codon:yes stop_codon:yes gene_type:complete